jgi:hypothetical protein
MLLSDWSHVTVSSSSKAIMTIYYTEDAINMCA